MRQEIGQKTQSQQAEPQQHDAGQGRQRNGAGQIVGRALLGNLCQRSAGHQGGDRHRAHRQRAAGAEQGIGNQRSNTGVQTDFRRQPCQHGVGKRLRDQHDGHDHRGNQIAQEAVLIVVLHPPGNRE